MTGSPRRSLADATYAITADTGELGRQAALLCRSLRRHCPRADVVTFVPEASWPAIDRTVRSAIERLSTVVTGEMPIPEFPQSAALAAFVRAAERADTEHVVLLDTDVAVLSPPTVPDDDADLYLKPADLGTLYWGNSRSYPDWRRLYDHFGVPFPDDRVVSTVDRCPMLPYWNAGVVVTRDRSLPSEWLSMTRETLDREITSRTETFFNDQLALAVLSETRSVSRLTERQNYPLHARVRCPRSTEVLHYDDRANLARLPDPWARDELRRAGADLDADAGAVVRGLLDVGLDQSGRVLSYREREALRTLSKRVFA